MEASLPETGPQLADSSASDEPERRMRAMETEVAALRQRLAQREAALAALNRRLLRLSALEHATGAGEAAAQAAQAAQATVEAEARADDLQAELDRLRSTRTFRWTAAPRDVYRRVRRLARL